jgi:hypothetical protein
MRYTDACEDGQWHLHIWPIGEEHGPETQCQRIPFTCRSWRHEGECRKWRGALDFWRIKEAIKKRKDWVYIVLTFHQGNDYQRWQTYFKAGKAWDILRKRITRKYGKLAYVQTWERHVRGGCHVNLLLGNALIAQDVELDWKTWRACFLRPNAVGSGFGYICWVERLDENYNAMAGYLTKLANELTGAGIKNQVPVDAPPHFRRIRASRGLLPPPPEKIFTGQLVKIPLPEYNYSQAEHLQPCGCVGQPKHERSYDDADSPSSMAHSSRPDGS